MIKNTIKPLAFIVTGIIIASFMEPTTLATINQIVYDLAIIACDFSRMLLDYIIEFFSGETDV